MSEPSSDVPNRVRLLDGDEPTASIDHGILSSHDHIYAPFGIPSGDPDLHLNHRKKVTSELIRSRNHGLLGIVEMSTYDMRMDPNQTLSIARQAGVAVVKSTGWYKSPTMDPLVNDLRVKELADRLVTDITQGFEGCQRLRAGVIGETGMTGTRPSQAEEKVLIASAMAALTTGVGIILHTDSWDNATHLASLLRSQDMPSNRILLGHLRVSDPLDEQLDAANQGYILGFDQLGHPKRDSVSRIAERIASLVSAGCTNSIVVGTDMGRLSRLYAGQPTGVYAAPVLELLRTLEQLGMPEALRQSLSRNTMARFLSLNRSVKESQ